MRIGSPAVVVACVVSLLLAATASAGAPLSVTKVKHDRHHGTAIVLVKVSAPGRLYLRGRRVVRTSVKSSGAGIAKVTVKAKGQALKALRATGEATVQIALKFVNSEGSVSTTSRAVTLRLKP
ncbi:MAG: hypothetical protein QM729_11670 [Solirubrobacterales bacterium]